MTERIIIPPDPERMIEGLRDTGYTFKTAIADIIDNSISAKAKNISVIFEMDFRGSVIIRVIDDGDGMDEKGLLNAMKYGSNERPDPMSLGKFGLGLKTASTAFCRKLSVISRASKTHKILKAIWDLDHVAEVDEWEVLRPEISDEDEEYFNKFVGDKTGTIIVWEKTDRLLKDYADPTGRPAQKALKKLINELDQHLGMTYQRFLDKDDPRENQKIIISFFYKGETIQVGHWNPFVEKHSDLVAENTQPVSLMDSDKEIGEFTVRAFVLPRKNEFPEEKDWEYARLSNALQGFYIYRENRLIHHGDWLGMFSNEPHFTLLRVEFSFDHKLDNALQVDIKKSKISLNDDLYKWLKDKFIPGPRNAANKRYRQGKKEQTSELSKGGAHDSSNKNISNKEQNILGPEIINISEDEQSAEIQNTRGQVTLKIRTSEARSANEIYLKAVDSLNEGLLWEPALIKDPKSKVPFQGVYLNSGHEFYSKIYIPNIQSSNPSAINIEGLDALFWALARVEINTIHGDTKRLFNDIRYEVSRMLRLLVEDLPEPDLEE
jgi:hypothetical protein